MTDTKTDMYCPYCGKQGLIAWDSWSSPDGHDWYECLHCKWGAKGFKIGTKAG